MRGALLWFFGKDDGTSIFKNVHEFKGYGAKLISGFLAGF